MSNSLMARFALVAALLIAVAPAIHAQDDPAVVHAKQVLAHLEEKRFEEVAKEFTPEMTAAMPVDRLSEVWAQVREQVGAFGTFIDTEIKQQDAITAARLGCRFDKAEVNVIVTFDADKKIAGLRIMPRQ